MVLKAGPGVTFQEGGTEFQEEKIRLRFPETGNSELDTGLEAFPNLQTSVTAFQNSFEKSKDVCQIKPESTVNTTGVEPLGPNRIMPFD